MNRTGWFTVMLATLLLCCSVLSASADEQMKKVKSIQPKGDHNLVLNIYKSKDGSVYEFRGLNNESEPFTVNLSMELENFESSVPLPFRDVLAGKMTSETMLLRLTRTNPGEKGKYSKLKFSVHPKNPPRADAQDIVFSKLKSIDAIGGHKVAVAIYKNSDGSVFEFRGINGESEPFTLQLSMELENLQSTVPLPLKKVLEGNMSGEAPLFRLTKISMDEPGKYKKLRSKANPVTAPRADAQNLVFSKQKTMQAQGGPDVTLVIYKSSDGSVLEFRAQNKDSAMYGIEVAMELDNMRATTSLPFKGSLDGEMTDEKPLFRIARVNMEEPFHYRKLAWYLKPAGSGGDRPVVHNGVYGYPWPKGRAFTIDNGYNGYGAHQGAWGYAVDFKMPVGTPIAAAREGKVIAVQTKFSKGGNDPSLGDKANYVFIQHPDGSVGRYLHIRKDGATVRVGQEVQAGDLIAYSGNVGWSTDPHLHFDVVVPDGSGGQKTIPFTFQRPDGSRFAPVQGMQLRH